MIFDRLSLILAVPIGVLVGILVNYFADVLPINRRLSPPACRRCHQPYTIKGYLIAWQCSNCGQRHPTRHVIVLIVVITSCVLLVFFPFSKLGFWVSLPVVIFLSVIVVIDIEYHLVLFETSLFGLLLCMIYGVILWGYRVTLVGGLTGFLIMLAFYLIGVLFSKIVGKLRGRNISEVAFGFGDVFAGTFLGLLVGWPLIAGAIMVGMLSFAGFSLIYLLALLLSKRYRAFTRALPFVPFLILGVVLMFYL